jgi:CheY-like chemotaxis protein
VSPTKKCSECSEILIVDDEEINIMALALTLQKANVKIDKVCSIPFLIVFRLIILKRLRAR